MASREAYQQAETLIERFRATYWQRYQHDAEFNVVLVKYQLADIITDIGWEDTNRLFAYYFRTQGSHEMDRFIRQYHELNKMRKLQATDAERTRRLLAAPPATSAVKGEE